MDGSLHAVVHFEIQFGELVFLVGRCLLNVTKRRGIDNVANDETRNGLVLGDGLSSRDASVLSGLSGFKREKKDSNK